MIIFDQIQGHLSLKYREEYLIWRDNLSKKQGQEHLHMGHNKQIIDETVDTSPQGQKTEKIPEEHKVIFKRFWSEYGPSSIVRSLAYYIIPLLLLMLIFNTYSKNLIFYEQNAEFINSPE